MRYIPKDPRVLTADGWLTATPSNPNMTCSWCDVPWTVTHRGAILCPVCDVPRRTGSLRPINLDATVDE